MTDPMALVRQSQLRAKQSSRSGAAQALAMDARLEELAGSQQRVEYNQAHLAEHLGHQSTRLEGLEARLAQTDARLAEALEPRRLWTLGLACAAAAAVLAALLSLLLRLAV